MERGVDEISETDEVSNHYHSMVGLGSLEVPLHGSVVAEEQMILVLAYCRDGLLSLCLLVIS